MRINRYWLLEQLQAMTTHRKALRASEKQWQEETKIALNAFLAQNYREPNRDEFQSGDFAKADKKFRQRNQRIFYGRSVED